MQHFQLGSKKLLKLFELEIYAVMGYWPVINIQTRFVKNCILKDKLGLCHTQGLVYLTLSVCTTNILSQEDNFMILKCSVKQYENK